MHWDILVTVILIYSCIASPAQIALWEELHGSALIINYIVDALFLVDILIIFNSATYNENFEVVFERSEITWNYVTGWFFIDVVSIIPFELFFATKGEAANLVRYARIGRIFKMLKLMRLLRLMKLQK